MVWVLDLELEVLFFIICVFKDKLVIRSFICKMEGIFILLGRDEVFLDDICEGIL